MTGSWLIWLIIGITVIQWIYGKAQEQAELNRAKRERERARDTSLRTGRGVDLNHGSKPGQMSESDLQARRQAQLKVLRERQAQQQRQAPQRSIPPRSVPTSQPQAPPPARRIPSPQPAPPRTSQAPARPQQLPSAPTRPSSSPLPGRASPSPVSRSQQLPSAAKPPSERVRAALQSKPAPARASAPPASRPLGTLATIASERREQSLAEPAPSDLVPRSLSDWRRAIIASEILAPPMSVREI